MLIYSCLEKKLFKISETNLFNDNCTLVIRYFQKNQFPQYSKKTARAKLSVKTCINSKLIRNNGHGLCKQILFAQECTISLVSLNRFPKKMCREEIFRNLYLIIDLVKKSKTSLEVFLLSRFPTCDTMVVNTHILTYEQDGKVTQRVKYLDMQFFLVRTFQYLN